MIGHVEPASLGISQSGSPLPACPLLPCDCRFLHLVVSLSRHLAGLPFFSFWACPLFLEGGSVEPGGGWPVSLRFIARVAISSKAIHLLLHQASRT